MGIRVFFTYIMVVICLVKKNACFTKRNIDVVAFGYGAGRDHLPRGRAGCRYISLPTEMSENNSPLSPVSSRNQDLHEEIDIDLLIAEVRKRPPLYETTQEQLDGEAKEKLWIEVCQEIFKQWSDFDSDKKKEKAKDVQTIWRILRDTFFKKFMSSAKKRKCNYFNSLSFLNPTILDIDEARYANNNNGPEIGFATDESKRKTPDVSNELPSISAATPSSAQTWQFPEIKGTPQVHPPKCIIQQKDDTDENMHFALMLVSMMKKFDDEQRYHARVAILRSMRQISLMGQKISVLQDELKYPGTEETNLMPDLNFQVAEETAFDDGQEYPMPAPIVDRPTDQQGEIQYPETDTEDVDV